MEDQSKTEQERLAAQETAQIADVWGRRVEFSLVSADMWPLMTLWPRAMPPGMEVQITMPGGLAMRFAAKD